MGSVPFVLPFLYLLKSDLKGAVFMTSPFMKVKEFHQKFDVPITKKISSISPKEASDRASFKLEEIIEFLKAASGGDTQLFLKMTKNLEESLQKEVTKQVSKSEPVDILIDEADALIDLLYFTYGTFVKMNIDPEPLFDIVHEANMGKLFPDGKPHYDKITGKVLKPDNWEKDYAPEGKIRAEINRQQKQMNKNS